MRSISLILIFVAVLFTSATAQSHNTTVSISGGQFFNNPISSEIDNSNSFNFGAPQKISQITKFSPQIAFKVEQKLFKHLSVGLILHSTSSQAEKKIITSTVVFTFPTQTTVISEAVQSISSTLSGASLNFKAFFVANPEVDAYIGLSLGGLGNHETVTTLSNTNPNTFLPQNNGSFLSYYDFNIGMRYFLPNNLGVFAEIGTASYTILSGTMGQVGVVYSF